MALTTLIACFVGFLAGLLVCFAARKQTTIHRIETLAVGMFGAVAGGDLVSSMLPGAATQGGGFHASSLLLAAAGAAVFLGLLALMRRTVGPLKPHKLPRR